MSCLLPAIPLLPILSASRLYISLLSLPPIFLLPLPFLPLPVSPPTCAFALPVSLCLLPSTCVLLPSGCFLHYFLLMYLGSLLPNVNTDFHFFIFLPLYICHFLLFILFLFALLSTPFSTSALCHRLLPPACTSMLPLIISLFYVYGMRRTDERLYLLFLVLLQHI